MAILEIRKGTVVDSATVLCVAREAVRLDKRLGDPAVAAPRAAAP